MQEIPTHVQFSANNSLFVSGLSSGVTRMHQLNGASESTQTAPPVGSFCAFEKSLFFSNPLQGIIRRIPLNKTDPPSFFTKPNFSPWAISCTQNGEQEGKTFVHASSIPNFVIRQMVNRGADWWKIKREHILEKKESDSHRISIVSFSASASSESGIEPTFTTLYSSPLGVSPPPPPPSDIRQQNISSQGPPSPPPLLSPIGMAFDPVTKLLFISDTANHVIRKLNVTSGVMSTLAGTPGQQGFSDSDSLVQQKGSTTAALFRFPTGLTLFPSSPSHHHNHQNPNENSDYHYHDGGGVPRGSPQNIDDDGRASGSSSSKSGGGPFYFEEQKGRKRGVSVHRGTDATTTKRTILYVCDTGNNAIRAIDVVTGLVTTVNVQGTSSSLLHPVSLSFSPTSTSTFPPDHYQKSQNAPPTKSHKNQNLVAVAIAQSNGQILHFSFSFSFSGKTFPKPESQSQERSATSNFNSNSNRIPPTLRGGGSAGGVKHSPSPSVGRTLLTSSSQPPPSSHTHQHDNKNNSPPSPPPCDSDSNGDPNLSLASEPIITRLSSASLYWVDGSASLNFWGSFPPSFGPYYCFFLLNTTTHQPTSPAYPSYPPGTLPPFTRSVTLPPAAEGLSDQGCVALNYTPAVVIENFHLACPSPPVPQECLIPYSSFPASWAMFSAKGGRVPYANHTLPYFYYIQCLDSVNCHGRGRCISLSSSNCMCENGWEPPDCVERTVALPVGSQGPSAPSPSTYETLIAIPIFVVAGLQALLFGIAKLLVFDPRDSDQVAHRARQVERRERKQREREARVRSLAKASNFSSNSSKRSGKSNSSFSSDGSSSAKGLNTNASNNLNTHTSKIGLERVLAQLNQPLESGSDVSGSSSGGGGGSLPSPVASRVPDWREEETADYVFWFCGGLIGGHQIQRGNPKLAFLYLITLGGFGLLWLFDLAFMLRNSVLKRRAEKASVTNLQALEIIVPRSSTSSEQGGRSSPSPINGSSPLSRLSSGRSTSSTTSGSGFDPHSGNQLPSLPSPSSISISPASSRGSSSKKSVRFTPDSHQNQNGRHHQHHRHRYRHHNTNFRSTDLPPRSPTSRGGVGSGNGSPTSPIGRSITPISPINRSGIGVGITPPAVPPSPSSAHRIVKLHREILSSQSQSQSPLTSQHQEREETISANQLNSLLPSVTEAAAVEVESSEFLSLSLSLSPAIRIREEGMRAPDVEGRLHSDLALADLNLLIATTPRGENPTHPKLLNRNRPPPIVTDWPSNQNQNLKVPSISPPPKAISPKQSHKRGLGLPPPPPLPSLNEGFSFDDGSPSERNQVIGTSSSPQNITTSTHPLSIDIDDVERDLDEDE